MLKRLIYILSFSLLPVALFAQEINYDSLMVTEVENVYAVKKPIIGVGAGVMNFYGELHSDYRNFITGNMGYKVTVTTYLDNEKRYFKGDFFFLQGSVTGEQRSTNIADLKTKNRNFKSNLMTFGVDVNYEFGHFARKKSKLTPFISAGVEMVLFDSKTDLSTTLNGETVDYNYWPDGTMRNIAWYNGIRDQGTVIPHRDYNYETDLRQKQNYARYTLAFPFEAGVTFKVSERIMLKVGTSLHVTLGDYIDNVVEDSQNDMFSYTYCSLHFDLFSSKSTIRMERYLLDVDFDYAMWDDEDGDGIFDRYDQCAHTPYQVAVDTSLVSPTCGCPLDNDHDGVPDFRDKELDTRAGAIVDNDGREMTSSALEAIFANTDAINRSEVEAFLARLYSFSNYAGTTRVSIPDKFKAVDEDKDGYISYDELLSTMNKFFDFETNFDTQDIFDLNEFFFTQ